jgi:phospholipid/cholesterol/gamma-HCH transport system substrate-binding protein
MSKAFRLGVFIVATLAVFAGAVFWIGNKQFLFSSTYKVNADFQNVAGLADGAEVRVGGIHEGTVHRIYLPDRPDRKVRVEMYLKGATRAVVKKDSRAVIRTEGLVGDQYVEVSFGSTEAPAIHDGDTIPSEPPLEISDLIKKTNAILDSAGGAMRSVNQTADNLDAISSKINQGSGTVGALINDRSAYQHLNAAATEMQEDMEALKHNFLTSHFFKKRGYEDQAELTKYAIGSLPAAPSARVFEYPAGKLFDKPDSAKIKKGKMLDDAGRFLEGGGFRLAVVAAYEDQKGDTAKDKELTAARALTAREYLVQHFRLDDTKVKTFAAGKSGEAPDGGQLKVLVYAR